MPSDSLRSQLLAYFWDPKPIWTPQPKKPKSRRNAKKSTKRLNRHERERIKQPEKREAECYGETVPNLSIEEFEEQNRRLRTHRMLSRKERAQLKEEERQRKNRVHNILQAADRARKQKESKNSTGRKKPARSYTDEKAWWLKRRGLSYEAVDCNFGAEDRIPFEYVCIRFERESEVRRFLSMKRGVLSESYFGIGKTAFLVCGSINGAEEIIRSKYVVGVRASFAKLPSPYSRMGFWGQFEAWNSGDESRVHICDIALPRGVIIRNGVVYGPARKTEPPKKLQYQFTDDNSVERSFSIPRDYEIHARTLPRIHIIYTPMGGQPGYRMR